MSPVTRPSVGVAVGDVALLTEATNPKAVDALGESLQAEYVA